MKVIRPGREQKGWACELECTGAGNKGGGCGARLLVEQADVYQTHSGHYDGSTDHFNTFRCAACGVQTDIAEPLPFSPRERESPPTKEPDHG